MSPPRPIDLFRGERLGTVGAKVGNSDIDISNSTDDPVPQFGDLVTFDSDTAGDTTWLSGLYGRCFALGPPTASSTPAGPGLRVRTVQLLNVSTAPGGGLVPGDPVTLPDDSAGGDVGYFTVPYPSAVAYHQQRLVLASTLARPETVWLSRTGRFKNFTRSSPIQADDGFDFTLAGRRVNEITHLLGLERLILFGRQGVHNVVGDDAGIVRPTAVNPRRQSPLGSSDVTPLEVEDTAFYVQDKGTVIRDLNYSFQTDRYQGNDITTFATHLFDGFEVADWAYQQTPDSLVWVARNDGALLCLSYVREQNILAWTRHELGGGGLVRGLATIPEEGRDAVYMLVERNGAATIERMASREFGDVAVDAIFLDSHRTFQNASEVTVPHLADTEVAIFADGYVLANPLNPAYAKVVADSSGKITLGREYSTIHVGLPYLCDMETLDIDTLQSETFTDKAVNIQQVLLKVTKTRGLWAGESEPSGDDPTDGLYEFKLRSDERLGEPVRLSDGNIEVGIESGWDSNGRVFIRQVDPLPASVNAIVPSGFLPTGGG